MATVYKIEIELVSDWINYTPEEVKKRLKYAINKSFDSTPRNELEVSEVKVERKV